MTLPAPADGSRRPWSAGAATGVGSLPGDDVREALRLVLDVLPELPYLPELPHRGPPADMVGRSAALLVDLHVDLEPSWRITSRPGADERRARSTLAGDLDALEELAQGWTGPFKVQVAGPWTLAASLELPRGQRVLADPGACRDLTASLTEGLAGHVADLRRRLPGAEVLVQVDEPSLPAVLAGTVPTASGLATLRPVEAAVVVDGLGSVLAAVDGFPLVHCCAGRAPVGLLRTAGARAVSVDLRRLDAAGYDALAEAADAGVAVFAGTPGVLSDGGVSPPGVTVQEVRALAHRLGLPPGQVPDTVVVTPPCGLAGSTPAGARAAMVRAREVAQRLADDPEG